MRPKLAERAREVTTWLHARGRALTVTLHMQVDISFTIVHLDPAIPMAARCRLMETTAQHMGRTRDVRFLSGDWKFTLPGEETLSGGGALRLNRTQRQPPLILCLRRLRNFVSQIGRFADLDESRALTAFFRGQTGHTSVATQVGVAALRPPRQQERPLQGGPCARGCAWARVFAP